MKNRGFTLIEIMITVTIIGILSSTAVPGYLGMQSKAKRRSLMKMVSSSKSEVHSWMVACANSEMGVIDVNGDGQVANAEAITACSTVATAFVVLHSVSGGMGTTGTPGYDDRSPYNGAAIFALGNPGPGSGQIGLQSLNGGRIIVFRGWDNNPGNPTPVFSETVSIE